VAARDERWPVIVGVDSNRDFTVEFVALRASCDARNRRDKGGG
jgi:hypothetical protein